MVADWDIMNLLQIRSQNDSWSDKITEAINCLTRDKSNAFSHYYILMQFLLQINYENDTNLKSSV